MLGLIIEFSVNAQCINAQTAGLVIRPLVCLNPPSTTWCVGYVAHKFEGIRMYCFIFIDDGSIDVGRGRSRVVGRYVPSSTKSVRLEWLSFVGVANNFL